MTRLGSRISDEFFGFVLFFCLEKKMHPKQMNGKKVRAYLQISPSHLEKYVTPNKAKRCGQRMMGAYFWKTQ